jgi:hypothetical protein
MVRNAHGLRMLRHPPTWKVNRSGDRHRLESDRVVRHCGSRPRPSSRWMPNQSGLWRPFEAGRHHKVWRSTRQVSAIILLTAEVPAAREGVESLRTICAGSSVRNPTRSHTPRWHRKSGLPYCVTRPVILRRAWLSAACRGEALPRPLPARDARAPGRRNASPLQERMQRIKRASTP